MRLFSFKREGIAEGGTGRSGVVRRPCGEKKGSAGSEGLEGVGDTGAEYEGKQTRSGINNKERKFREEKNQDSI